MRNLQEAALAQQVNNGILQLNSQGLTSKAEMEEICNFLKTRTDITSLNLANNSIDNEGIEYLAKNLTIPVLNIKKNKSASEEAIQSFASNTHIKTLELDGWELSEITIKKLSENQTLENVLYGENSKVDLVEERKKLNTGSTSASNVPGDQNTTSRGMINIFIQSLQELGKKAKKVESLGFPESANQIQRYINQFIMLLEGYTSDKIKPNEFVSKCEEIATSLETQLKKADSDSKASYENKNIIKQLFQDLKDAVEKFITWIKKDISYKTADEHMKDLRGAIGTAQTFFSKEQLKEEHKPGEQQQQEPRKN